MVRPRPSWACCDHTSPSQGTHGCAVRHVVHAPTVLVRLLQYAPPPSPPAVVLWNGRWSTSDLAAPPLKPQQIADQVAQLNRDYNGTGLQVCGGASGAARGAVQGSCRSEEPDCCHFLGRSGHADVAGV